MASQDIKKDVMIDIETLSTNVDALVLSIGARSFTADIDQPGPLIGDGILLTPSFLEQVLAVRRIDRETQLWWSQQDPGASLHWREPAKILSVRSALVELGDYIRGAERVWCRGTHFDVAILDSLHQAFGLKSPWKYNAPRDVRSFTEQRGEVRTLTKVDIPAFPAHHPLEDCRVQIIDLWEHGLK